jgi:hypothetical protein
VLATGGAVTGFENLRSGVFMSESADEWRKKLQQNTFADMERAGILEIANSYSWEFGEPIYRCSGIVILPLVGMLPT